jgi:glycosyltransferase involved in cell wall biosynthesis
MSAAFNFIGRELKRQIDSVGSADIVVGIPSYNNSSTIHHVVNAVSVGIMKYFRDAQSVIVNSDGGSTDGTPNIVMEAAVESLDTILVEHPIHTIHRISTPYHGLPGKGSAFRTIFMVAQLLGARAVAVVDSDLRSITPEWVELLLTPILRRGYDFVAPRYQRHKYDGTITNSIVYPMTYALYGAPIRQPIGGDFGFSGKLASHFLTVGEFDTDIARYGIDIWMTTTALASGSKVCQAFLGAKIHDPKDPGADLSSMLVQVVGSLFYLMERYEHVWMNTIQESKIEEYGFRFEVGVEPINVDLERLVNGFRHGVAELSSVWRMILDHRSMDRLKTLAESDVTDFSFPDELWVRILYDFAIGYHRRTIHPEHVVRSLTPLYLGRTAGFINRTLDSDATHVEKDIEDLCSEFSRQKEHLIARWNAR